MLSELGAPSGVAAAVVAAGTAAAGEGDSGYGAPDADRNGGRSIA
jgi:hypothetical protein